MRSHQWVREKTSRLWHHVRVTEADREQLIVTRCGLLDVEWDRAGTLPGSGAAICRDCLEAEEFDDERVKV